ncbi:uncharacterized protein BCR38DRAFT_500488 [Pseudomassariella vexata]|uniref:Uncharacterized protein n=1 Tax=Pseudomassariella vexata TaxID=1141098 RepID=A0A1Y2DH26_9PEZI|nr:uncharacterized protein BCR38DRAFT_500488 [Pseudomassariella vexata]ORY58569.1 hypothetical protein BCR38DRAFT_500488 [Pseudomassariella vexata]
MLLLSCPFVAHGALWRRPYIHKKIPARPGAMTPKLIPTPRPTFVLRLSPEELTLVCTGDVVGGSWVEVAAPTLILVLEGSDVVTTEPCPDDVDIAPDVGTGVSVIDGDESLVVNMDLAEEIIEAVALVAHSKNSSTETASASPVPAQLVCSVLQTDLRSSGLFFAIQCAEL